MITVNLLEISDKISSYRFDPELELWDDENWSTQFPYFKKAIPQEIASVVNALDLHRNGSLKFCSNSLPRDDGQEGTVQYQLQFIWSESGEMEEAIAIADKVEASKIYHLALSDGYDWNY